MKQGTYPTDLWATDLRAEWLLLINGGKTKWILPSSGCEKQHLRLKNLFHSAPASFPQSSCYQSSGHHTWISPDLAISDPKIKV